MERLRRASSRILSEIAAIAGLAAAVFAFQGLNLVATSIGAAGIGVLIWSLVMHRREVRGERTLLQVIHRKSSPAKLLDATGSHLQLGAGDSAWRLSLYELEVPSRRWVLRARGSSNDLLRASTDFQTLSVGEGVLRGCIDRADGPHGATDELPALPDANQQRSDWDNVMLVWGHGPDALRSLDYHARSIVGRVMRVSVENAGGQLMTLGLTVESGSANGSLRIPVEENLGRPFFEAIARLLAVRALCGEEVEK